MPVQRASHCVYEIHYHLVFPVKYRKALLRPEVEAHLVRLAHEIEERYEFSIEEMGTDMNHIHLLCSAHPKHGPGEIVRIFKSITARELFKALPELRRELWGGQFWSDGYYVGTVGERSNWEKVACYVQGQGQSAPQTGQLRLFDL